MLFLISKESLQFARRMPTLHQQPIATVDDVMSTSKDDQEPNGWKDITNGKFLIKSHGIKLM